MAQPIDISTLDTATCKELLKHFMDKNQTVVTAVPPPNKMRKIDESAAVTVATDQAGTSGAGLSPVALPVVFPQSPFNSPSQTQQQTAASPEVEQFDNKKIPAPETIKTHCTLGDTYITMQHGHVLINTKFLSKLQSEHDIYFSLSDISTSVSVSLCPPNAHIIPSLPCCDVVRLYHPTCPASDLFYKLQIEIMRFCSTHPKLPRYTY